jgi:hypothetical protein
VVIVRSGVGRPAPTEAAAETGTAAAESSSLMPPEPAPPAAEPVPPEDTLAPERSEERKRIVVIRGKSSGETRIPLADEPNGSEESASHTANPAA